MESVYVCRWPLRRLIICSSGAGNGEDEDVEDSGWGNTIGRLIKIGVGRGCEAYEEKEKISNGTKRLLNVSVHGGGGLRVCFSRDWADIVWNESAFCLSAFSDTG